MANDAVTAADANFFPWSWSVSSTSSDHPTCPSSQSILGLYAAINAVCTVLSVLAGNSFIVNKSTCGLLGNEKGRPWMYMWILPFGLQLGANASIATLTKLTPGYADQFTIWELMLFYTLRPRLAWIFLGFIAEVKTKGGRPWRTSFISNMIAELLLQLIALYTAGTVVRHAATMGYYLVHTDLYKTLPKAAHLFYGGSMYYCVSGSAYILYVLCTVVSESYRDNNKDMALGNVFLLLITTWLGSWLFWAGFVQLAGDR
ncbi:hypothetical protein OQA88_690 [Cercophora sp. LCS_1]